MKIARPKFDHQRIFSGMDFWMQDFEVWGLENTSVVEEKAICVAIESGADPEACLFRHLSQLGSALRMDVHAFMGFTDAGQSHWLLAPDKMLTDPQKGILEKYAERCLQLTYPIEPLAFTDPIADLMPSLESLFGLSTVVTAIPVYSSDGQSVYGVVFLTHPISVPSPTNMEWTVAYFHVYARGKPLQMLFYDKRLSVVPQPTQYPVQNPYPMLLSVYDRGTTCLSMFTLKSLLSEVGCRGSIQDVATFLDDAARLIGYKKPNCKKEYLFKLIECHASREEAETISKTSSQSVEAISRTASQQPWEQTLPVILEMLAVAVQEMPAIYWVMPNVEVVEHLNLEEANCIQRFVIQHNVGIPDPSLDEAAALRAVAHWTAIRGDMVYDDPKKKFPFEGEDTQLVQAVRPVLGNDIPFVAIPVYGHHWTSDDKPVYHGTFVGLRSPTAKYPTAVQLLTWAMMAQYLLDPIIAAKNWRKLDYKPVDVERAADLAKRLSKSARRLICSPR